MKSTFRALVAVSLLLGMYVLAIGFIVGGIWLLYLLVVGGGSVVAIGKLGLLLLGLIILILPALWKGLRPPKIDPGGMLIDLATQPTLKAELEALSRATGTGMPHEVRLMAQVNAAVMEEGAWLGLASGKRRLLLGIPLMYGLTVDEMRAVLGHEFGHYSGKHTALGGVVYRGHAVIGTMIERFQSEKLSWVERGIQWLFESYGKLFMRVSNKVSRGQEFEADRLASDIAGPEAMTSALAKLEDVSINWDIFLNGYALAAAEVGIRPQGLFEGFGHYVSGPASVEDAQRVERQPHAPHPYDTHPPTADRIAALSTLPALSREGDTRASIVWFDDPSVLSEFEAWMFQGGGLQAVSWAELSSVGMVNVALARGQAVRKAYAEGGNDPTLGEVLHELEESPTQLVQLTREGMSVHPEHHLAMAAALTHPYVTSALCAVGARPSLDWSGGWITTLPDKTTMKLGRFITECIESGEVGKLRAVLAAQGVDFDFRPTASEQPG